MTPPNAPTAAEREREERICNAEVGVIDRATGQPLRCTRPLGHKRPCAHIVKHDFSFRTMEQEREELRRLRIENAELLESCESLNTALLAARRENEKDKARWDWYEENATKHGVHLSCWDVGGERNNGWTVGLDDEDNLGKGVDARMAIDDAMRHPERLRAALAAAEETR